MLTSFGEPPPLAKLKKRAVLSKFLLALCYRSWRDLLRTVTNSCRWQELWTHPGSRDASVGNGQMAIVCHIVYSSIHPMSPCPNKSSHCATWKVPLGTGRGPAVQVSCWQLVESWSHPSRTATWTGGVISWCHWGLARPAICMLWLSWDTWDDWGYPLVNVYIAMERSTIFNG
jgi:hypothetical protein